MPKFAKGEKVKFAANMHMFIASSSGKLACAWEPAVITEVKGNQYKIKGYTGFWPENFFEKMED